MRIYSSLEMLAMRGLTWEQVSFVGLLQNVGQYPLERDAFYRVWVAQRYWSDR